MAFEATAFETLKTEKIVTMEKRSKTEVSIRDTFGIDFGPQRDENGQPLVDKKGNPLHRDMMIPSFTEKTEWTPHIDPHYVFPKEETKMFLMGMNFKDNILITGHSGSGKTSMCEQIAARLNYSCVKINFDSCISRQDLIGEWIVKDREMVFQPGILILAFQKPGTIIILDEWDTISKECSFVLQRPLQKEDRQILVLETGGNLIPLHPDNIIVATANTVGQGDDTGLYSQGTNVQNFAQLNRFGLSIKLNYLDTAKETEVLHKRFPDLSQAESAVFMRNVKALREGFVHGELSVPVTHRDLVNWVEKFIATGDPMVAAKYTILNRMTEHDAVTAEQIIQRSRDDSTTQNEATPF